MFKWEQNFEIHCFLDENKITRLCVSDFVIKTEMMTFLCCGAAFILDCHAFSACYFRLCCLAVCLAWAYNRKQNLEIQYFKPVLYARFAYLIFRVSKLTIILLIHASTRRFQNNKPRRRVLSERNFLFSQVRWLFCLHLHFYWSVCLLRLVNLQI